MAQTILVVDDEAMVTEVVWKYLRRERFEVVATADDQLDFADTSIDPAGRVVKIGGAAIDLTAHIRQLRSKIEPDPARPSPIKTVWGVGYKFEA